MALQKFLFVGIGGSGGLTIAALRHILLLRLEAEGYDGGIPKAWQFVNIDVAASQGGETDGIRLLPEGDYLGLTRELLEYREEDPYRHLDGIVSKCGQQVDGHVSGWRPNCDHVRVDVTKGAGQFRAIGRLVIGAMMPVVRARLETALGVLRNQETNTELARVSQALTGENRASGEDPQAVVITSLAGGSGSGQVSDVCDLIRKLAPGVARQQAAILYAPDVFSDLKESERHWINPNALATISELLNAHWNTEKPDECEFALLNAAGGAVDDSVRMRGPRLMYVVGRANGSTRFNKQYDVYRAVGRALAAWTTSSQLQARFRQYELGNVTTQAQRRDDTGLKEDGNENPLGSLGFASVGIGLERFTRYSAQRLARSAVEHLLRGHWPSSSHRTTISAAREARANEVVDQFLDDCGLRRITDAVRGMSEAESRDRTRALVLDRLVGQVTEAAPRGGLPREEVQRRILNRTSENLDTDVATITRAYIPNAARWAASLQSRVARAASGLIAAQGLPVAYDVLQIAIARLRDGAVGDLREHARRCEAQVAELGRGVQSRLATPGPFLAGNPFIRDAAEAAVDTVHARCEKALAELCGPLIADLAASLLAPLRDAIGGARDALRVDFDGTPERPSPVKGWPVSVAPTALEPAPNELLLEPVEGYPDLFESLVLAGADGRDTAFGNALAQARREVISGERDGQDLTPTVIVSTGQWRPRDGRLRADPSASSAGFTVRTRAEQLLLRARAWIQRPDSSFGDYLRQTLTDYLDPKGVGDHVGLQRRGAFERLLAEARRTSSPFIELDSGAYTRIHGGFPGRRSLLTPFPFPLGHPARAIVTDVFTDYNEGELGSLFGDDPTERIDLFTFLSSPVQPIVMHSLVGPIRDQWASVSRGQNESNGFWTWRRARPLPWFVPCAPGVRRAMVCGWFAARFLGAVPDVNPNLEATRVFCPQEPSAYAQFPHPLLGPPIATLEEWMPAVLESLVLALIGQDLTPYHRLRALGGEIMAPTGLGSAGELLTWISLGKVPAGAPTPDERIAGPAGDAADAAHERRAALRETVDRYRRNFARFPSTRLTANGLEAPRAWELREDILLALSAIEAVVDLPTEVGLGGLG